MKRFRNILVHADGHDGGRAALKRGIDLAVKNDARLTIVEVVPEIPPNIRKLQELKPVAELEQMTIEDAALRLEDLISECDVRGLRVETDVLIGTPFLELIRRVLVNRHDLVLKTAAQPHGISERIFGTTGLQLLRQCPCPVWIMKPESQDGFRTLLVAIDVFSDDAADSRLNFDLLQIATSFATRESAKLHAVTAWEFWMENYLRGTKKIEGRVDAARKEIEYAARQKLEELLSAFPSATIEPHVKHGEPDQVIPRVAQDIETDLLIMGTVGRSGLSGMFMGNTADRILNQVNCSVLALKPADFETPVDLP